MVRRLDYHIHTKFCKHAIGEMSEYVEAAISKSIDEIGFADHLPMIYLPSSLPLDNYCMALEQFPIYIQSVKQLQQEFPEIIIKLGIEADYYMEKEKDIKSLLQRADFDYVYGSVHAVGDPVWVIDDDRYRHKYQEYEIFDLYQLYFTSLTEAIQTGLYDIIAHLDLPKKYGDKPEQSIQVMIDEVVEALRKNNVSVEVNTSGFRKPAAEQYPSSEILRACYENDIQVTLGSDSHRPQEVGWELDHAIALLKEIGYSQIIGFEKRKKVYFEI